MHSEKCSLELGYWWRFQGLGPVAKRTKRRLDVGGQLWDPEVFP